MEIRFFKQTPVYYLLYMLCFILLCYICYKNVVIFFFKDREGTVNEAKGLLYKILKDKLAEELRRRDSMKIRNAINRFAFYGVSVS